MFSVGQDAANGGGGSRVLIGGLLPPHVGLTGTNREGLVDVVQSGPRSPSMTAPGSSAQSTFPQGDRNAHPSDDHGEGCLIWFNGDRAGRHLWLWAN